MLCPACLAYTISTEAVATVNGTQYCAPHSVEALQISMDPRAMRGGPVMRGPANMVAMSQFTPPQGATPPQPPAEPPTA